LDEPHPPHLYDAVGDGATDNASAITTSFTATSGRAIII